MYAYLTILTGKRSGTNFPLDPSRETLIGRGTDCHISLPDPLCSRVHAILHCEDGERWIIRDHESRNGTMVNGQKIHDATLGDGHRVKLGSHEFEFRLSADPADGARATTRLTQTIVQDLPIAVRQSNEEVLAALPTPEQVQELMLLYQLAIRLLGCDDPDEVIRVSLELLEGAHARRRSSASCGSTTRTSSSPSWSFPQGAADRVTLNKNLTELVLSQGHAVWVANQAAGGEAKQGRALCRRVCARWFARAATASGRRSAPSTCIWKTAGSASPTSTSSSPWPTWW